MNMGGVEINGRMYWIEPDKPKIEFINPLSIEEKVAMANERLGDTGVITIDYIPVKFDENGEMQLDLSNPKDAELFKRLRGEF